MYGRRQTPLSTLISILITAIVLMLIFLFFQPICSLIILVLLIVIPAVIIWSDHNRPFAQEPMTEPLLTTTKVEFPIKKSYEIKGIVFGSCVKARNIFSQARADLRSIIGGEAKQYTSLMDQSRQIALNRVYLQAKAQGCNGIIGLRFITAQTMTGAAEIIAYGTAVKY